MNTIYIVEVKYDGILPFAFDNKDAVWNYISQANVLNDDEIVLSVINHAYGSDLPLTYKNFILLFDNNRSIFLSDNNGCNVVEVRALSVLSDWVVIAS